MGKTVLFSPVGGTDPISQSNMYEGSMLHIIRHYQVDKVFLYMSREMLAFQEQDDRYRYCIHKLAELQKREIEIEEIAREDLTDVQDFDYFYEDLRKCILDILNKLQKEDRLLVNISSGTPAMKSGLLVLTKLGELDCSMIQVSTPIRSINEHKHDDYDVETLWELNMDNQENAQNRCVEVTCPMLSVIKQEEIIKGLVREYDYKGAYHTALKLPARITEDYLEMLEVAYRRIQQDHKLNILIKKYNMSGFPVESTDQKKYFEYMLDIDVKRKRGEHADFLRALSPLIFDLFVLILKNYAKIDITNQTYIGNRGELRWKSNGLDSNISEILSNSEKSDIAGKIVYSRMLCELLINICAANTTLVNLITEIRKIEGTRNLAAHQIMAVTEDKIKEYTGKTSEQIVKLLHKAFPYAGCTIKEDYWNAYEDMNQCIINRIEKRGKK